MKKNNNTSAIINANYDNSTGSGNELRTRAICNCK